MASASEDHARPRRDELDREASAARVEALALLCTMGGSKTCILKAGPEGNVVTAEQRGDLLTKSKAGEHVKLTLEIVPFRQITDTPNRKHVRFAVAALKALGRSGANTPFLKDHAQGDTDARGGTVTRSAMNTIPDGHELRQTVAIHEPWAVQRVLTGAIDRFSIGWNPTGPVLCSNCGTEVLTDCFHWPADRIQTDDGEHVIEWVFTSAELLETSGVPVPAVLGTRIDEIRATLTATLARSSKRENMSKKPVDPQPAEIKASERKRILGIRRQGVTLKLDEAFIQKHTDEGTELDVFAALAVDEYGKIRGPVRDSGRPALTSGEDETDKQRRAMTDWMLASAGKTEILRKAAKKRGKTYNPATNGNPYRGMTILDMIRESLTRAGVNTVGMTATEVAHRVLSSGHQTTGDFVIGLENALHKQLLARYETTPDTWSLFCATGSATDFRPLPRYRRGSLTRLEALTESGEIRNKEIPDVEKEVNQLDTFANIVALTRKVIINDDLGFLMDQASDLGTAAADTIELTVYELLAENGGLGPIMQDGKTLFHADHNNIGTAAALSITSVDKDRLLMKLQKDVSNNKVLNLRPSIHLVSAAFEILARKINLEQNAFDTGLEVASKNMMQNLFAVIVGAVHFTGTRRYQFAEPSSARVLEVLFLNNQRTPILQMEEGFRTPGIMWSALLDIGVGAVGTRGTTTNAGA